MKIYINLYKKSSKIKKNHLNQENIFEMNEELSTTSGFLDSFMIALKFSFLSDWLLVFFEAPWDPFHMLLKSSRFS